MKNEKKENEELGNPTIAKIELTPEDKWHLSFQYTHCYGTHGNQGEQIGECPFCHNPLYDKEE